MTELFDLYQELILDHSRRAKNARIPESANRQCRGVNPLCGDQITVGASVTNSDVIADIGFAGTGCAICMASASMMIEATKGKSVAQALTFAADVCDMVVGKSDEDQLQRVGKLAALRGVVEFPMRVKCATLAWHALRGAIEQAGEEVTTE